MQSSKKNSIHNVYYPMILGHTGRIGIFEENNGEWSSDHHAHYIQRYPKDVEARHYKDKISRYIGMQTINGNNGNNKCT